MEIVEVFTERPGEAPDLCWRLYRGISVVIATVSFHIEALSVVEPALQMATGHGGCWDLDLREAQLLVFILVLTSEGDLSSARPCD